MKNRGLIIVVGAVLFFAAACNTTSTKSDSQTPTQSGFADNANYTCPMHPEVLSDHPGDCPKCGMKLEMVTDKDTTNLQLRDTV